MLCVFQLWPRVVRDAALRAEPLASRVNVECSFLLLITLQTFLLLFLFKSHFCIICTISVCRIQKATESLKSFRPAAQTSFEDYVVNTSKQTELLGELSFFSSGKF